MDLELPPAAAAAAGIKAMTVCDIAKKERPRHGGTDRESRCSRIHIKGVQIVRASASTKAAAFCKTARVLKYDQWYHHWACVLTALQKCKAESDYYYYYYYYKLLTYHTEIPDYPPQWTGMDRDRDVLVSNIQHNTHNTQATSLKVNRERTQRSKQQQQADLLAHHLLMK